VDAGAAGAVAVHATPTGAAAVGVGAEVVMLIVM